LGAPTKWFFYHVPDAGRTCIIGFVSVYAPYRCSNGRARWHVARLQEDAPENFQERPQFRFRTNVR
jgi:hypothetical protein